MMTSASSGLMLCPPEPLSIPAPDVIVVANWAAPCTFRSRSSALTLGSTSSEYPLDRNNARLWDQSRILDQDRAGVGPSEMVHAARLRVDAARWETLQRTLVQVVSIPEVRGAGADSGHPVVAMQVRRDRRTTVKTHQAIASCSFRRAGIRSQSRTRAVRPCSQRGQARQSVATGGRPVGSQSTQVTVSVQVAAPQHLAGSAGAQELLMMTLVRLLT